MTEGHVAHAEVIEHAQYGQTAVERVSALHPDQTGDSALLEDFSDA